MDVPFLNPTWSSSEIDQFRSASELYVEKATLPLEVTS